MADLGTGAYNLARFSRWGRFLALAGFGNLPGDLVVHEKKDGATWKQLAATRSAFPSPPTCPPARPPARTPGARNLLYAREPLRKAWACLHALTCLDENGTRQKFATRSREQFNVSDWHKTLTSSIRTERARVQIPQKGCTRCL